MNSSMSLLEALVAYCVTNGALNGDGVDAFRDFTPEAPDSVIVFHEYASDPIPPDASYVHRSVHVKVRDKSAEAARDKSLQVMSTFVATTDSRRIDFTDTLWGQVYIRQAPFKISQDELDRVSYGFNLGITTNIFE